MVRPINLMKILKLIRKKIIERSDLEGKIIFGIQNEQNKNDKKSIIRLKREETI